MLPYRPFYLVYLFGLFVYPTAVLAIVQNVTITSVAEGVQYRPSNAWTISSDSLAAGGSFTRASAENATASFNITIPSTALFWRGFLPRTAARYSICIDCSSLDTLGSVVTIDSGTQHGRPVVLFASKPLANTTHSIVVRNLRNPIEGVVGEISLDSFSFATDVEVVPPNPAITPPTRVPSPPSAGEIAGIVIGSVVVAGILLALARCISGRLRKPLGNCSAKRSKIWRRSLLPCGPIWKRHRRTASSESSPIIEAVWKSKPLTAVDELPTHNVQTQQPGNVEDSTIRSFGNQPRSTLPVITITSPSTNSTTASLYSNTHQDAPAPLSRKLSLYETDRGVRQSDPYASYAVAYAAFAGVTSDDDDGDDSQRKQRGKRQQSALRDSSLLPPMQMQDRGLQSTSNPGRTMAPPPPPPPAASSAHSDPPPSSFNGRGIREGKKGTRTLSDKIKRGTLPTPPQLEEGVININVNVTAASSGPAGGPEGGQDYLVEGDLKVTAKPKEQSEPSNHRPSIVPTFSSDASATPPKRINIQTPLPIVQQRQPSSLLPTASEPTDNNTADPAFWSSYGDFSILETAEGLEQVADSSSDGVESTLDGGHGERSDVRRQSLQLRSSPSPTTVVHRASKSEGAGIAVENAKITPQPRPLTSTLSIMTVDTSRTHTTRSSYSFTPSVSEFPMPPFKQGNVSSSNGASRPTSTAASDTNTSGSAFTDLVASTPPSSSVSASGSTPRSNVAKEKIPPSAFATAIHGRSKRSKTPSLKVSSSGLVVPLPAQARLPARRGSKKRRSQSPATRMVQLPIRGDALAPPLPNSNSGEKGAVGTSYEKQNSESRDAMSRKSTLSEADTNESGVPFYMNMLKSGMAEGERDSPLSFDHAEKPSTRDASRMTMASMLTTTDEEYSGDVQLVVARRQSLVPDLPKPVTLAPSTAVSLLSEGGASNGSSNGQWEMVVPNRKPAPGRAAGQGMPSGLSISTDRSPYRTANVPVSARTDMFDAGTPEVSHTVLLQEPNFGLGSGMGMPWSPNFDWPATPPVQLTSSAPPAKSDPPRRYDYPTSISNSTVESWTNEKAEPPPYSRPMSQTTIASGKTPVWKDIVNGATSQRSQPPSSRESTYSTASTFFGGISSSQPSPGAIPPVPSMPPPLPAVTRDFKKPTPAINTRQGWHVRPPSSQSPIEKSRPPRQRQTGYTAVGAVNSIFATPQTPVTRPKLSLQRVEKSVENFGNPTPTSRYNSPYTAYLSPPSSAEPLISNR